MHCVGDLLLAAPHHSQSASTHHAGVAPDSAVWVFFFFGARMCSRGNQRRHSSPTVLTSTILHTLSIGWWEAIASACAECRCLPVLF